MSSDDTRVVSAPCLPSVLLERPPAHVDPTFPTSALDSTAVPALPRCRQSQQPMTQSCQRITGQVLRHDPMSTVVLLVTLFPRRIIIRQRQQRRCTTRGIRHGDKVERIVAQILERVQRAQLLLGMIMSERSLSYIP